MIQFGGQTPLKLAVPLEKNGVKILGTSPVSIDMAEDREKFNQLLRKLDLLQPPGGIARSESEAIQIAKKSVIRFWSDHLMFWVVRPCSWFMAKKN